MLTEQKLRAINLLVENKHKRTDIADMCDIDRKTLYNWMDNAEFVAKWEETLQAISKYGQSVIKANLANNVANLQHIANNTESDKLKADCLMYLVDRVLGRTKQVLDIEASAKQPEQVDFDAELDDIVVDIESE